MDEDPYDAAEVKVIDVQTSVRKRPAMYFGTADSRGIVHVVNELVSNGADLFLKGNATRVGISFAGDTIIYADDGPGLPYDLPGPGSIPLAEHYLTHYHYTPTADSHAPHVHLNGFGLGMAPVNAVCEFFEVKTWRSGCLWAQRFEKGLAIEKPQIVERGTGKGTTIWFELDGEVFRDKLPDALTLRKLMFEAAHLFSGITLDLGKECFYAPNGLADLASLYWVRESPFMFRSPEPFALNTLSDEIQVNVGMIGESNSETMFRSWANGSCTPLHGTHVDGLRDALHSVKWKPAVAMIHVVMHQPQFAGPTRSQLFTQTARKSIRECLTPALRLWCDQQRGDSAR